MAEHTKEIIETIGTIEKKETLVTIGYDNLVLESLHPFPGYHGTTVPDKPNPKSVFLVTRINYPDEKIIRATLNIKKKFHTGFDAAPGSVYVFNQMEPCIRIKKLENYKLIPELLSSYKEEGISFLKGKNIEPYYGLINIKKYFLLDEINQGIYMDKEIPEMGYFEVSAQLDWDMFEKITLDIKHNVAEKKFDAALGTLYRKTGLKDIIRIYSPKICLGECLFLREKYNKEIEKHFK